MSTPTESTHAPRKYDHTIGRTMALAARKVGIPDWIGFRWTRAEGGSVVYGAVNADVYKRGPMKGKPKYIAVKGTERTVVVTDAELDAAAAEYERDTGKCYECQGTGEVFAGWSREGGARRSPCTICAGSGIAKEAAK